MKFKLCKNKKQVYFYQYFKIKAFTFHKLAVKLQFSSNGWPVLDHTSAAYSLEFVAICWISHLPSRERYKISIKIRNNQYKKPRSIYFIKIIENTNIEYFVWIDLLVLCLGFETCWMISDQNDSKKDRNKFDEK